MANRPNPDGWKGGSEDFGFVRTFDGHLGREHRVRSAVRPHEHAEGLDDANLGGEYRTGDDPSRTTERSAMPATGGRAGLGKGRVNVPGDKSSSSSKRAAKRSGRSSLMARRGIRGRGPGHKGSVGYSMKRGAFGRRGRGRK
jgi:hypothetical protein